MAQESSKQKPNVNLQKPRLPSETLVEKKPYDYAKILANEMIFAAVLERSTEHIQQSLDTGADVNARDKDRLTPLHYAAKHGTQEACAMLLDSGADANAKDKFGSTALMEASSKGNIGICAVLISKGADVNMKDNVGSTPLHCAAWAGHVDICMLLIEKGANASARDSEGFEPWRRAEWAERPEVAKLLMCLKCMRSSLGPEETILFAKSFRECISGGK
jgi:ankyrin repeat protein